MIDEAKIKAAAENLVEAADAVPAAALEWYREGCPAIPVPDRVGHQNAATILRDVIAEWKQAGQALHDAQTGRKPAKPHPRRNGGQLRSY